MERIALFIVQELSRNTFDHQQLTSLSHTQSTSNEQNASNLLACDKCDHGFDRNWINTAEHEIQKRNDEVPGQAFFEKTHDRSRDFRDL